MHRFILSAVLSCAITSPGFALGTSQGDVTITEMASGLDAPWAMGFLPDGGFMVTERGGRLWNYDGNGNRTQVTGLPDIHVDGQGGLLDVMIPRDFAQTRQIYMTFAKAQGRGEGTAVAVGRLNAAGDSLEETRVIFEIATGSSGGRHFGSRLVEALDGTLFLTVGDRGDRPSAQDLAMHNGSVLRINRDGSVPDDNPFVGQNGVQPEIWSYGHRNPQGAALDLQGNLWVNEHGARGGDEVNQVKRGANFGWPVISYGRHYSGLSIGEGTSKEGMEQPAHYWDPSIAPSGMMIYSGTLWPEWRGDMFVGSLKFSYISRLDGDNVAEVEQIEGDETVRVRDIREAPDGSIWFMSVGNGEIYRMTP
ncbi:PQQ-dependent sugar dehydrogenase [Parasulfitobacter algicola]|uniref:PQQ-dependent sugar dehydrogenase n=1 Tax=Parasulfitobacter algicola TaxID=2614809 RepID=A0ABX2IQZ5_9RHOB|nr:PQQ-dependent sugar dehydrogenase [Sulfitobacter algicola]NSX55293.1 PQQ-dependent sugar dehydrogenase [Sulfitobacter algicola]